jgi:hypothetical protein
VKSDKGIKTVSKQTGGQPVMARDQSNHHQVALMKAQQAAASGPGTPTVASAKPVATQGSGAVASSSAKTSTGK